MLPFSPPVQPHFVSNIVLRSPLSIDIILNDELRMMTNFSHRRLGGVMDIVLAIGPKVSGLSPARRLIFKGDKNP
jgi:hypothetical protein